MHWLFSNVMRYTIFINIKKPTIFGMPSNLMMIIIKDALVNFEYRIPVDYVDSILRLNDFPDRKVLIQVVLIQNNKRQEYSLKYLMFSSFLYSLFMPKKEDTTTTTLLFLDSSVLSFFILLLLVLFCIIYDVYMNENLCVHVSLCAKVS